MSVFADLLLLPDNRHPGEGRGPGRWRAAYATPDSGLRRNDGIRIALALPAAFLAILLFSSPAFA